MRIPLSRFDHGYLEIPAILTQLNFPRRDKWKRFSVYFRVPEAYARQQLALACALKGDSRGLQPPYHLPCRQDFTANCEVRSAFRSKRYGSGKRPQWHRVKVGDAVWMYLKPWSYAAGDTGVALHCHTITPATEEELEDWLNELHEKHMACIEGES